VTRAIQKFRQRDVTRAIRAVRAAGVPIARVLVDNAGKIEIVAGAPDHNTPTNLEQNEWDGV
jgi:hypothetical protein